MSRYIKILAVLLFMQIAVSVFIMLPQSVSQQTHSTLIDLSGNNVSLIQLSDFENNSLTLKLLNNTWMVEQNGASAPADIKIVLDLINVLTRQPVGKPVSVSSDSLTRFSVANDDFQWKVVLTGVNKKSSMVYFGLTAGLNKRYVRQQDNFGVYLVEFPVLDKKINPKNWLKRDLIILPKTNFLSIKSNDYLLFNKDGIWKLDNQSTNEKIDQDLVKMFISRLQSLRIDSLVSGKLLAELQSEKPVQVIQITDNNSSKKWVYEFYKLNDINYLHRSDIEGYFEISVLAASDLLKIRNQWLEVGSIK